MPRTTVTVPLSNGTLALIDDADFRLVAPHRWHDNGLGYPYAIIGERAVYLARLILSAPPDAEALHIGGDPRDCRRARLRLGSRADVSRGARLRSDNGSGFRGVSFDRERGRWTAKIKVGSRRHYVGRFATAEEAARAYDAAARKYFGDRGRFNFPLAGERGLY